MSTQAQAQTRPSEDAAPQTPVILASPVAGDKTIEVPVGARAAKPYVFKQADFPFSDADGHTLASVAVDSVPGAGTLRTGNADTTRLDRFFTSPTTGQNGYSALTYYPESGQSPTDTYTSFNFSVRDSDNRSSQDVGTITIKLVANPANTAMPTGTLFLTATMQTATTFAEDDSLAVSLGSVTDADGIDASSISWKWQQAAPVNDAAPAADSASWSDISGATGMGFTPLQEHVGQYVRGCITFTDNHYAPATYTVCRTGKLVVNVNDAPTGMDTIVNIPTNATAANPTSFAVRANFPIEDEDGHLLDGIRIATLPTKGTLVVVGETLTLAVGTELTVAQLNNLAYYPNTGSTAMNGHDRFTYRVIDDSGDSAKDTAVNAVTLTINLFEPTNATGMPAVTYASDIAVPTEDSPITATQGTVADPDNSPTSDLGTIAWQWSAADTNGGAYTDIGTATAAAFTPGDDEVGRFLQVCASFTDSTSIGEERCHRITTAVANVNDAPTGLPYLVHGTVSFRAAVATAPASLTQGQLVATVLSTSGAIGTGMADGGPVADADGIPTGTSGAWRQSIQSGTSNSGPWVERTNNDKDANPIGYTLVQEDVNRGWMRTCAFYRDGHDTLEGAPATTTATSEEDLTQAERLAGTLCSTPVQVNNINDAPVVADSTVAVPTNADDANPYQFSAGDFIFTDADGDMLASVTIEVLPSIGTLALNGATLTNPITAAQLEAGELTYHPADTSQEPTEPGAAAYATFTFRVTDDGHQPDATTDTTSTATATMGIRLSSPQQTPASGAPTISPAIAAPATDYDEDTELTASTSGITEPNGIDRSTLMWDWQSSATSDSGFTSIAMDGDHSATFTPLQAHVGQYIRVCASFMDRHETPMAEGPLCSTAAQVANVSDAPVAQDNSIHVSVDASMTDAYNFSADDFPFTDEDGDEWESVVIESSPDNGTLSFAGGTIADGTPFDMTDVVQMVYYPDAGQDARTGYATFTFNVVDDGDDGGADTSTNTATLTINLVSPDQTAATGMPTVTPAADPTTGYAEDAELTASTTGITEPNGIDTTTLTWQWQQSASASGGFTDIAGATGETFTPDQPQVGMHIRACASFRDLHIDLDTNTPAPASEGPLCSASGLVANANDAPMARPENTHNAMRADDGSIAIPVSAFMAAYSDPDGDDPLESVTITELPLEAEGTLSLGDDQIMIDGTLNVLAITNGEFTNGPLTLTMEEGVQTTTLKFTLSDGDDDSNEATLTITLGSDIAEEQVTQISAILSVAAVTNATTAIGGAISSVPTPTAFDISMDGTSLMGAAQKLGQSKTADSPHQAWYLGTAPQWEHNAAYNASDNSAESLLNRLQSMANGDIALNYSITDTSTMRFWARYQSLDLSGNEGESLEYDGSGTGFYLGADNQITERLRIGLAIGTDSSDISIDLDDDKTNTKDEATRSATSFYPYLHIDLGNNNNARVIAGFGSGTLDIKSTANSDSTASADLSWNMLAASISHHKALNDGIFADWLGDMADNLSARFDGSLQLGNTSVDAATFSGGSTLMAADSSASELSINAELRYQSNNITPFASLAARKLGGDISQSVALDMAFGADLTTSPANLRIAITRQINDTTHQRHSISLDASTRPSASGISASLGSRYDSITGKPQWQSTIGWQRSRHSISLAASPGDYRLRARLRW